MKFLALIHADDAVWASLGEDERAVLYERYRAFADEAGAAGKLVEGNELRPASTATTVRVLGGETVVTDGPFAELREQIGGYFVLDCDSIDEAVAWAARIPAAERGAIEVRPAYGGESS